jgi:hypothetical protein
LLSTGCDAEAETSGTATFTAAGTDAPTEGGEISADGGSETGAAGCEATARSDAWLAPADASITIALDGCLWLSTVDTLGGALSIHSFKGEKGPTAMTAAMTVSGPA